ncbi:hypothetical protein CMV_030798 [Castanea mollissima]|uniref:Uncharacterized protein n=1 Tax=Castanea mollissima TaxID=60419 RepID=A0A8J4Q3N5_9ROSI|nr:hypothetical protein CMV_030798 [Castanea mollissima]
MHTGQASSLIQGRRARVAATYTVNGHLIDLDDSLLARNLELKLKMKLMILVLWLQFGCLHAISTILESASRLPQLFVQVEPTLVPIMRRMLTSDGQGFAAKEDWWALYMLLSITLKGPCVCFRKSSSGSCAL